MDPPSSSAVLEVETLASLAGPERACDSWICRCSVIQILPSWNMHELPSALKWEPSKMEGDSRPSQELTWGDHTSSGFVATPRDSVELEISSNPLKPERCLGKKKDVRMGKTVFSLYLGFADRNTKVQRSEVVLLKVR